MVFQQIDFIDIQIAAVGPGQQAWLKGLDALGQSALQVQRADHAVFSGAQRQIDHRHANQLAGPCFLAGRGQAIGAAGGVGVATIAAAGDGAHLGQQGGQSAHGGGLAGAPVAKDQHAANRRIDSGQHDGQFHIVLADDGGKRKGQSHGVVHKR